ncbi:hypothetical protein [Propionivibrio dicarboxylicus]|uniref:Lipoprotein n=1 Tax=Propionivibrio dicarboxylicus TaxID=83767 RepID=A0A1G7ZHK1_9RHOO|nr:hypothetical protein [Propionivibrio dicarboxylicus]SDH08203.1 hypothetical protein SAMN05660652_01177 [Propionivibrio dicarboxylicus]
MKSGSWLLALACLGMTLSAPSWAGPHAHVGVVIGPGAFWGPPPPYYAPYPYPYYVPAPVVVQTTPPVYVQQPEPVAPAAAAAPAASGYWYYCAASKSYYPYVKECPVGWQRVSPQPPAPQ